MKIYSIKNKNITYGYLFINKTYTDCYIELIEGLDEYPIFFQSFVNKNIYCLNSYWAYKWINERIIPYERKNINDILKENDMKYYNELLMLISSKGKSSMDDNKIEEVNFENIIKSIKDRINYHIVDFIYSNNNLIVFLKNGQTKILKNINYQNQPFLSIFGNEIIFDSKNRINYLFIAEQGDDFPLSYSSLIGYINNNILSSKEIVSTFGFSRQHLNKLKKDKNIISLNNNLYILNDIKQFKEI